MLHALRQWTLDHWAKLESLGLRIELHGQTDLRTVKTNHLYVFTANTHGHLHVTLWEMGDCDGTVYNMAAEELIPLEECFQSLHYEVNSPRAIYDAMEVFLGLLMEVAHPASLQELFPAEFAGGCVYC